MVFMKKDGETMLKFQFKCSEQERVRAEFENMMLCDTPCGKGIFGNHLWKRGIHFKECGERISGFYIQESENEGMRGSPLRVCFRGRFLKKGDGTVLEVYIYPRWIECLLLLLAAVSVSLLADMFGMILSIIVFSIFMVGYMVSIKNTVAFFARWVR